MASYVTVCGKGKPPKQVLRLASQYMYDATTWDNRVISKHQLMLPVSAKLGVDE
jgi:hypothetical protein